MYHSHFLIYVRPTTAPMRRYLIRPAPRGSLISAFKWAKTYPPLLAEYHPTFGALVGLLPILVPEIFARLIQFVTGSLLGSQQRLRGEHWSCPRQSGHEWRVELVPV